MRFKYEKYNLNRGFHKVKTRTAITLSAITLAVSGGGVMSLAAFGTSHADNSTINFEAPAYTVGDISGQNGWNKTGSYDAAVVSNTYGYTSFGDQSLRISNSTTSSSFGDQTFAPALSEPAGEAGALDKDGNPVASTQPHFEAQFDVASTTQAEQPGMALSVSPDNGAGARMSYLSLVDESDGIHVNFYDVEGTSNPANFVETPDIAILSYDSPHTVKLAMDFVDGPSNDVVKVYVDGNMVHQGTSWENYYRYDPESNPGLVDVSRTVDTLLFHAGGTAVPANAGHGYLFDNLSLMSGPIVPEVTRPTSKDDCRGSGWTSFSDPSFKNQGQCVAYVNHHDGVGKDDARVRTQ